MIHYLDDIDPPSPAEGLHRPLFLRKMSVTIYTFGFKFPDYQKKLDSRQVVKVYDVREAINDLPPKLESGQRVRDLSGKDLIVREAIMKNPAAQQYVDKLVEEVLNMCETPSTSQLSIAVGCKSGRHRSATVAYEICSRLEEAGIRCKVHNLYIS